MTQLHSPAVTVGIPTYNQPAFLKQAVQGVLAQTFQDFEIIIVDDCSTDDTAQVAKSFGDPRIRYFKTATNLRPPRSWNACVRQARGRFFALLPHDDVWLPDFLETMIRVLDENPAIGFAQCNFYAVRHDLVIKQPVYGILGGKSLQGIEASAWQLRYLRCNPASLLFRLEKMNALGLWREDYWDDWAFIVRLAYVFGFKYIPSFHSAVREHDKNLCKILGDEGRIGALYVLDQLLDVFGYMLPHSPESLTLFSDRLRELSVSLFFTAAKALLNGDRRTATTAYHSARRINPLIPFDCRIALRILQKVSGRNEFDGLAINSDEISIRRDQARLRSCIRGEYASADKHGQPA